MMEAGEWDQAADLLRQEAIADPEFGATELSDLCLGRAMIGARQLGGAVQVLAPLRSSGDPSVREAACLYSAWAEVGRGELEAGFESLSDCGVFRPVRPEALLLPRDRGPAALLVFQLLAREDLRTDALLLAAEILNDPMGIEEASLEWVLDVALELAKECTEGELTDLEAMGDEHLYAFALYGRLAHQAAAEEWEAVLALLPEVRARLTDLGAESGLIELDHWTSTMEESYPPLFGAVLSLSGPQRRVGRAALAGVLLAEGAFDQGEQPLSRVLIRDATESPERAREVVAELDQAGVIGLVAYVSPDLHGDLIGAASERGIALLLLAVDENLPTSDTSFQFFASPEAEAAALARFAQEEGLQRLAVALPSPTPDYMQRLAAAFTEQAEFLGLTVLEPSTYRVDELQTEADAVARSLASHSFDGLLIADTGEHASTLAAYLGVQDIWSLQPGQPTSSSRRYITLLGNSFWHDPALLHSGPDYLAGAVFPTWLPTGQERPLTQEFISRFEAVYGRRPSLVDTFAHDALALLRYLVLEGGIHTRRRLCDAIRELQGVDGVTGELRFEQGRRAGEPGLMRITSDGFVPR